jgi:hypothetical protein
MWLPTRRKVSSGKCDVSPIGARRDHGKTPSSVAGAVMKEVVVERFVEFIRHSESFDLAYEQMIFRGQAKRGNLLPGIARNNPTRDTTALEKKCLQKMRLLGASLLPREESDLDLLIRAQHFGLQTRLLDWTSNPLAALWFACSDRGPGDVYVYGLAADSFLHSMSVYDESPFKVAKTRALQPRLNNPRVIAQDGWFTLHRYSGKAKRFVSLEDNPDSSQYLYEYRIPEKRRAEMLASLDRHGVSSRTLFPDLEGLCRYLNWRNSL